MTVDMDFVTLINDEGKEERFEHVLTFEYEKERYTARVPEGQAECEEAEVIILHVVKDEADNDIYVTVDNEVLLEEVFDEFLSLMDEIEGEEE